MKVIIYNDTIIAQICTAVTEQYHDSKVSSNKSVSDKSADWTDYTITVDWS